MRTLSLTVFLPFVFCLSVAAECPIKETQPGRCLVGVFRGVDLNNDGGLENVKVIAPCFFYTNLEDSDWGDDTGIVIVILDDDNNELFWDEVVRERVIENIEVLDADQDGLPEVVISVEPESAREARAFLYGWDAGAFREKGRVR